MGGTAAALSAAAFREAFGSEPVATASAPGRVNLLGGHVDYNDGLVLPVAIDRFVAVSGAPRDDGQVRLRSRELEGTVRFSVDEVARTGDWGDYAKGVVWTHREAGDAVRGFDACFASTLPVDAGVASSAAVEVATSALLQHLFDFATAGLAVARLAHRAESDFVGMRCGVMDQLVSALGLAGHLLYLDCRSLEHEPIPIDLEATRVVVVQTGVTRRLAASEYNRRREQCERGVALLRSRFREVRALRDVTAEMLADGRDLLPEMVRRRCQHVVDEISRVARGAEALRRGDLSAFGELMYQSHRGSRDLFEVSCPELDVLVDSSVEAPGSLGGRVTGAGFGGSTVHLVAAAEVEGFLEHVGDAFRRSFGRVPDAMVCRSADGAFSRRRSARSSAQ